MSHRKSIAEHKTAGTYKKSRHAKREEEAGGNLLASLPPPPFVLTSEAAEVYEEEGKRLIEMKMLKPADLRTLAMYASEMSVYVSEMEAAREEGFVVTLNNGATTISHHRRAAEQALKLAGALSDKLGLNPNARHRLQGAGAFKDNKPEQESEILKMMRGGIKKVKVEN